MTKPPSFPLDLPLINRLILERAISDLRRATPVILLDATVPWLVLTAEAAAAEIMTALVPADTPLTLVLTANRAESLGIESKGALVARRLSAACEAGFADPGHPIGKSPRKTAPLPIPAPLPPAEAAIRLVKAAQLLPSVVLAPLPCAIDGLMALPYALVLKATLQDQPRLKRLAEARVPLRNAKNTRLVSFRDQATGTDHLALLIGDPINQDMPLVRLHSSCITGDLLGSLRCDCGEQLRGAIISMNEAGGGILLYLQQEGRGIGIANKLRAYALQDEGLDTIDANMRLGFESDERDFSLAAEMLRQLGVSVIRLLTNNPHKLEQLAKFGIEVRERVQHAFPSNPHNRRYLDAKARKAGHLLPADKKNIF